MNELTIRLEPSSQGLPAEAVWLAIRSAVKMLESVAKVTDASPGGHFRVRVVAASMRSPYWTTFKGDDAIRECARPVVRGAGTLERESVMPPGFDVHTAKAAGILGDIAGRHGIGVILEAPNEEPVRLTRQTTVNVDKLLGPARKPYGEWTTIRGVMDLASARKGGRFEVRDRVLNTVIVCTFDASVLLPQVKEGLFSRVEISGPTEFSSDGTPKSMFVEKLRSLDVADPLPLAGLAGFGFTGDEDHADYILELRDDE